MLVQIDNFFVPIDEFDGTAGATLTIEQNDGLRSTAFSNEISFSGETKKHILDKLVFGATPLTSYISVRIFDDCCLDELGEPLLFFSGKATQEDISWCEDFGAQDCDVVCTFVDDSTVSQKVQCVRNTIIHAKANADGSITSLGENEYRYAPFFGYYEETRPKAFSFIVSYILIILLTLYIPLVAVLFVLSAGFVGSPDFYRALLDLAFKKRLHKAPFVHSYMSNVCKLCGLTLQSSLFEPTEPLHNMTRLDAAFSEGGDDRILAYRIFEEFNRPNITLPQLMDSFAEMNIGYRVTDTHLIVERKDLLSGGVWIDFTNRARVLKKCYPAGDQAQPAGEIFSYGEDQSDKVSNEATRAWSGEIVNYNNPTNPILRGIRQTTLQYSAARFVNDEQYVKQESVLNTTINTGYFSFITFGNGQVATRMMISQSGTFSLPKLLMYDGFSNPSDASVERINGVPNGRLWLRGDMRALYNVFGLYDLLLYINDPRRNPQKNRRFEIIFNYTCEDLRTMQTARSVLFDFMDMGVVEGIIDTIQVNVQDSEITITGKI